MSNLFHIPLTPCNIRGHLIIIKITKIFLRLFNKELTQILKWFSSYKSSFTLNLVLSISRLPPNQLFEFGVFSPKNESMDGIQFSFNDKGTSIDMYGKNEISYGFNTSDILPN